MEEYGASGKMKYDLEYIDPKWNTKSASIASKVASVVYDILGGSTSQYHISASTYRDGTLIALYVQILDDSVPVQKLHEVYECILEAMIVDDRMVSMMFDIPTTTFVLDFDFGE